MNKLPCLQAALDYLALGWSAIPLCPHDHQSPTMPQGHQTECQSPGKAPLFEWKPFIEKLPSESWLKFSWNRVPQCNVGICMGPVSGLLGLDIDGQAGDQLLSEWASGQPIPDTLEFTTPGGGRRLLFQWPAQGIATKSFKVGGKEAIRILAKGTQTVAPPSIHATGGTYKWCSGLSPADITPAPVPAWLLARMTEPPQLGLLKPEDGQVGQPVPTPTPTSSLDRIKAYLAKCDPAIAHQGGHNQTFKVCCRIWDFDPTQDEDTAFALAWNHFNVKCQPPWTEKELRHKLLDARKQPRRDMGAKKNDQIMSVQWLQEDGFSPTEATNTSFAAIQSKPIEWLWPGWIPLGKLAMLDGDPGLGKSTLLLDIATRVSLGGIMPDNQQGAAGASSS